MNYLISLQHFKKKVFFGKDVHSKITARKNKKEYQLNIKDITTASKTFLVRYFLSFSLISRSRI